MILLTYFVYITKINVHANYLHFTVLNDSVMNICSLDAYYLHKWSKQHHFRVMCLLSAVIVIWPKNTNAIYCVYNYDMCLKTCSVSPI